MWSKARLTLYLTAFLGAVAYGLQALGLADYDPVTSMISVSISIPALAAWIVGLGANGVALLAVVRKWRT